jgi:hypothetical protein
MSRVKCAIGMLCLIVGLASCTTNHKSESSIPRNDNSDMDKRVQFELVHSNDALCLWMRPGDVFMWQGRYEVSEEHYCALVREATQMDQHAKMGIALDLAYHMSVYDFIKKLFRLRKLAYENLAPNSTLILIVEY